MPIVAAVDREGNSTRIVREGAKLAEAFGVELHVLHVLNMSDFVDLERTSVDETGAGVPPEKVREVAGDIATRRARDGADEFTPVGLMGSVPVEILEYAREHDAEYVVIGGRKRSRVGKVVFGSVTQSVLLDADRPIVAVMRE